MNWATGRVGQIVLLASVGLNLVLGTAIGVYYWRTQSMFRPAAVNRADFGIERMAKRLGSPDSEVLRDAYVDRVGEIEAAQGALRAARLELRKALEADPFVPATMTAAMDKMDSERDKLQKALQAVFATAAVEMSSRGRARLAQGGRRDRHGDRYNDDDNGGDDRDRSRR